MSAAFLDSESNRSHPIRPDDLTEPFQLGDWRIDPVLGRARSADETVKIDPRNMRVLQILAQRQGRPVSVRELQALAWDGTIVTSDSLYQSIRQLRQALRDTKSPPSYIETLPRRGYRLIAVVARDPAVLPANEHPQAGPDEATDPPIASNESETHWVRRPRKLYAAATLLTAGVALTWGLHSHFDTDGAATGLDSIDASAASVPLAEHSPETASAGPSSVEELRELGGLALTAGRPREALEYFERALRYQLSAAEENNEITANILIEVSRTQLWLDDEAAASQAAGRALAIFDRLSPGSSPDLILAYSVAAEAAAAVGDYAAAQRYANASLALTEQLYGENHVATVEARGQRAILHVAQRNLPAAEQDARQALATVIRARGTDDIRVAHWYTVLASVLFDQGRLAEAEAEARSGGDILSRVAGETHPYRLSSMHVLAEVLAKQGRRLDEAERLATAELDALMKTGASKWRIGRAAGVLGEVLLRRGETAAAQRHLLLAQTNLQSKKGWPLEREYRLLSGRVRLLSELRIRSTSLASL